MLTANMKMIAECADKLAHLGEKLFNVTEMKYRAGNKVRIKSLDWYNENKGMNGLVGLFTPSMKKLCGMVVTLDSAYNGKYTAIEKEAKGYYLDDSMIEGLADDLTKVESITLDEIDVIEEAKTYWDSIKDAWICPEGYIFKDENGNVIEAKKIVLEKKKKEYPKIICECCIILGAKLMRTAEEGYKGDLMKQLQLLLTCRDAYWKIAGEEMGWGKPWEPDDADYITGRYCIFVHRGNIICSTPVEDCPLTFPTEEMRDAFYENFKELIEVCKELL